MAKLPDGHKTDKQHHSKHQTAQLSTNDSQDNKHFPQQHIQGHAGIEGLYLKICSSPITRETA